MFPFCFSQFVDPRVDQSSWDPVLRERMASLLVTSIGGDKATAEQEIGRFILREGPFKEDAKQSPSFYWQHLAITAPRLAKAAKRILAIAPSEAAVERAFSHRKTIHSQIRNSLTESSVEALMFVGMNAVLLGVTGN